MRRSVSIWLVSLALALSICGCSGRGKNIEEKSAETLTAEGMAYFERGRYRKAIRSFEQLKDWYPFSKFAILAELKTADAHYHLKEYDEAILGYEEFEKLHPRNEAIPYVIYQIGRCYFDRMASMDRDQLNAQKARVTFERLIASYAQSAYARQAAEHVTECLRNLAGHDMVVGHFYFKSKHYAAALSRFEKVLTQYPRDLGFTEEAERYIRLCREKLAAAQAEG